MSSQIFRNSAICKKCVDELTSRYKKDSLKCSCGAIEIGGGLSFLKRKGDLDCIIETSLTDKNSFQQIRNGFAWGTCGKLGKMDLRFIPLRDLESRHIIAIINYHKLLPPEIKKVFEKELQFRKKKKRQKQTQLEKK